MSDLPSNSDAPFHCPPDEEEDLAERGERMRLERQEAAAGTWYKFTPGVKIENTNLVLYSFYDTGEWQLIRNRVIMKYGPTCMCCKVGWSSENPIQVDHIKPRSRYPELSLDFDNLQVLCRACNMGKSDVYEDDFRSWK